jgi:Flp pilus assembly pilin Flp
MRSKDSERHLLADEGGVYQSEYTIVLVLVALAAAVSIAALTLPLLQLALSLQDAITFPIP